MKIKASCVREMIDDAIGAPVNVTPVIDTDAEESEIVKVQHSKTFEEALRREIRKLVREELEDTSSEEQEAKPAKSTETLQSIADEFELSVSGAKRLVDVTLEKASKIAAEYAQDEDLELTVLNAIKGYIEYLRSSGELDEADVKLLYDHPDIVRELDGFREFLAPKIKRYLKTPDQEAQ